MSVSPIFHTQTALAQGLRDLFRQLEERLSLSSPLKVYLAGGMAYILLYVLSPLDLAVSKIARFADNDKDDIAALVRLGLTNADEIEQRATSALVGYIGGQAMLKLNLQDALALARKVEAENRRMMSPPL